MSRVNVYTNAGGGVESVNADARQAGKVTEVKRDVNDIRSEILSLKIMVQAMMEIMNERGIETEAVNARIEEIMTRPGLSCLPRDCRSPAPNAEGSSWITAIHLSWDPACIAARKSSLFRYLRRDLKSDG